jgi:ribonuclease BN (tRNA processing enzyme)
VADVVVTHRHGDHIGGLMALFIAAPEVRVHGPPDALEAARTLFEVTYPHLAEALALRPTFHPLADGERRALAGLEIVGIAVEHRVPTLALRVGGDGRVLAYSADSLPCAGLAACARDADLFVCDALCAESDGAEAAERAHRLMHPTARQAAVLAREAGARRLALVHLARFASPERVAAEARAAFGAAVDVPDDGARYRLE